jgi:hypothetical protein
MAIPPVVTQVAVDAAAKAVVKGGSGLLTLAYKAARNQMDIKSLADFSRPARIEPFVLIDKTVAGQPFMEDVMKMCLTTFVGYYLQAVSMVMDVGRIDTLKVLDALNPNRSVGGPAELKDSVFSNESWEDGLPQLDVFTKRNEPGLVASLEAAGGPKAQPGQNRNVPGASVESTKLYEIENLAIGKLLTVELRDKDNTAKIPVMVRLLPAAIPPQAMTYIFASGGRDSWGIRFDMYRAGQISFIRDFIFGADLVDEHRKAILADPTGTFARITDRRRNNSMKALATDTPSMADASNIAVISTQTAKEIASKLYGNLDSPAIRAKIFDNSYLLLLVVVNEKREYVTVYHRGLDFGTDYTFKEIKATEKNKGPDITEVFKMFHQSIGTNV